MTLLLRCTFCFTNELLEQFGLTHLKVYTTSHNLKLWFPQYTPWQDIKEHPVVIYMKGYPEAPRCGFSALAVKVLQQYGMLSLSSDFLKCNQ
jgi:hypothetical protein